MIWQVASFGVVLAVLTGGFVWYERTRPPSQIVALVAALAAMAIAGRLAFAAIPNVVATTDIVLVTGFAVGAAPGFAVGALTALVSNFWLGQGPWTPWQMVAWGLCGVFGALLAKISGRRIARVPLAVVCGAAGVAFGALMNFSLMATYGGDMTLERFATLQARAIPFDAAHAIGNITLALIAGPALIRMLLRFQERFEWRRASGSPRSPEPASGPSGGLGSALGGVRGSTALVLVALAICVGAWPSGASAGGVNTSISWLKTAQNSDGGFGSSVASSSSIAVTGWVMLGMESAGFNPRDVSVPGGRTAVQYLSSNIANLTSTGDLARSILAINASGLNPGDFGGRNLNEDLRGRMKSNGSFGGWPNMTAFGIMALRSSGQTQGFDQSFTWLRKVQNDDGGWGVVAGAASDADTTGTVLQVVGGEKLVRYAVAYLNKIQRESGGFATGGGGPVNSQSTAWATQGLIAAGKKPSSFTNHGKSPLDYLAGRRASDGHYRYSSSSDQSPVWVTAQAVVPVAGQTFPIPEVPLAPVPAPNNSSNPSSTDSYPGNTGTPGLVIPPSIPSDSGSSSPGNSGSSSSGSGSGKSPGSGSSGKGKNPGSREGESRPGETVPLGPATTGATAETASPAKKDSSPIASAGIGLGVSLLIIGGTSWLVRRREW